jgi:hypothetical protein
VVFSFDEKTQCQAFDRTQPSLPMVRGRAGTMTHDYKRHGTTELFAALNIATGQAITQCRKRHTDADVLAFFKTIDKAVPRSPLSGKFRGPRPRRGAHARGQQTAQRADDVRPPRSRRRSFPPAGCAIRCAGIGTPGNRARTSKVVVQRMASQRQAVARLPAFMACH